MKNTIWRHTKKGIRRGEPADRLYAVVGTEVYEGKTYLLAWKMRQNPDGTIWHPAFGDVKMDEVDVFIAKGENGAYPSALFRETDSLYEWVK